MGELYSVHRALSDAQFEKENEEGEMVPVSFRLTRPTKAALTEICDRQNISISRWLRKCCEGIVADYGGPREIR